MQVWKVDKMIRLFNQDCMTAMKEMPDKAYELAIVDPPYGIGLDYTQRFGDTNDPNRELKYTVKQWNESIPAATYFNELFRVSKHQIIWGCNFYNKFIATPGRIIWDKQNDNTDRWSHCDIASYSGQRKNTIFRFTWDGFRQGNQGGKEVRIHPTQKPVALYRYLLKNYAKPGDRILDTHLGSGSSAIAADIMGFDFTGYEIDADYFQAASERLERHQRQGVLPL
jgi:site-specific DNA-methyltransferase (adenine-specific)